MGTNMAENGGFLRAIKIHNMISLGGEVRSVVPRKILRHVKDPYSMEVMDTCR
jgi:hypothetical protein